MRMRRAWPAATVLLLVSIAGCGRDASPSTVAIGAAGGQVPASSTTIVALDTAGADPSPVEGITAEQLHAALTTPISATTRAVGGPTADSVSVPGGQAMWRVRVPGAFQARAARVAISIDGHLIGEAVLAGDLASISTVTTDVARLKDGATVTYRWEGGEPISAGRLVVIR